MFNPGDTATLLEDIISYRNVTKLPNKGVYGKKGERVKIISIRDDVAIVNGKTKFSLKIEKLEYETFKRESGS